ncbi:S-adenosyl-L-methionine-dependent methyltransferase [Hymenopellis radicata]|nr:S-adenosyl-L-methionine-dependent methyltransferase [Hymenopellis radicata]
MSIEPESSQLGTKQHWDDVYKLELENFDDNGNEGEVWFGEESVEKMIDWVVENIPSSEPSTILEVGSGNGTLLFTLLEAGYNAATLSGIDYSADAVKLATNIASTRNADEIHFSACDFLNDNPPLLSHMDQSSPLACWDLLLDKGTYDAIALGEKDEQRRSPAYQYPQRAARLLKDGGFFLITSCNFTEDELKASFVTPDTGFIYHSRIKHRSFSFGGISGSVVSSVAFKKVAPTKE